MKKIRALFLAGVLVTVPVAVTVLAMQFLFRTLDNLLAPLMERLPGPYIPGLGVVATVGVVFTVGGLTKSWIGRKVVGWTDQLFATVPLVRAIYKAAKEVVVATTAPDRRLFKDVALVEYPRKGSWSYGFVTSYSMHHRPTGDELLAHVFLPNPPVPTSGALIALPPRELHFLEMPVDDALRMVISGGILAPPKISSAPRETHADGVGGTVLKRTPTNPEAEHRI